MPTLNVGDQVYYPEFSTKIHTVTAAKGGDDCWCYSLNGNDYIYKNMQQIKTLFTRYGEQYVGYQPVLFPATEENHALLTKLYGEEFQQPKKKPYIVTVVMSTTTEIEVDATNEAEARNLAEAMYEDGNATYGVIDVNYKVNNL